MHINASLTCSEAPHAPTKALPLLVPKCLRKLSVLAIHFRIHKLKPGPTVIPIALQHIQRHLCCHFLACWAWFCGGYESCFLKVWAICFSLQCQSRKWQVWNLRELNCSVDSWKTRNKMAITRVAYGPCFKIRRLTPACLCVPPRDVQMGWCAPVVRTP